MTLCYSKMFLLVFCLFGAIVSIIEAAVYPAGSIEQRQATAKPICAYFSNSHGSQTANCARPDMTCQLAIALTPAVLFCGTMGQPPISSWEDYNPSVTCEEGTFCCGSAEPSGWKLEFNNGGTVFCGCGTSGGILTAKVAENILTLPPSTTATSTTANAQTIFAAASPSPTISGPKSSSVSPGMTSAAIDPSASPAKTSAASHVGSNSSGLSTASDIGSVLGAICGAIAVVVAIIYGTITLKRRHSHIALNFFHTNSGAGLS